MQFHFPDTRLHKKQVKKHRELIDKSEILFQNHFFLILVGGSVNLYYMVILALEYYHLY